MTHETTKMRSLQCAKCRGYGFVWIREVHVMCLACKGSGRPKPAHHGAECGCQDCR